MNYNDPCGYYDRFMRAVRDKHYLVTELELRKGVSWREPHYNDYIYQIILGGGISLYLAKLKITKIRTEEA